MEICISGVWGTVCDNFWDDSDARVVCRRLGFVDECEYCAESTPLILSFPVQLQQHSAIPGLDMEKDQYIWIIYNALEKKNHS